MVCSGSPWSHGGSWVSRGGSADPWASAAQSCFQGVDGLRVNLYFGLTTIGWSPGWSPSCPSHFLRRPSRAPQERPEPQHTGAGPGEPGDGQFLSGEPFFLPEKAVTMETGPHVVIAAGKMRPLQTPGASGQKEQPLRRQSHLPGPGSRPCTGSHGAAGPGLALKGGGSCSLPLPSGAALNPPPGPSSRRPDIACRLLSRPSENLPTSQKTASSPVQYSRLPLELNTNSGKQNPPQATQTRGPRACLLHARPPSPVHAATRSSPVS